MCQTFSFDEAIYAVAIPSDDVNVFAVASEDGTVQLCDIRISEGDS